MGEQGQPGLMYLANVTDFKADLSSISFVVTRRKKESWVAGVVRNEAALFEATFINNNNV